MEMSLSAIYHLQFKGFGDDQYLNENVEMLNESSVLQFTMYMTGTLKTLQRRGKLVFPIRVGLPITFNTMNLASIYLLHLMLYL